MGQSTPTMIQVSQGQMISPSRHSDVMISGMQMNGVHGEYPPVSMVGNNVQSQVRIKMCYNTVELSGSCIFERNYSRKGNTKIRQGNSLSLRRLVQNSQLDVAICCE